MARNPIITDEVKVLIRQFYSRHTSWKAWEIQKRVSQMLHSRNPELPQNWPGLNAVQRELAAIRKQKNNASPQDEPWSLASLNDYPIPPEAMPVVMSFYKKRLAEDDVLNIREALWVGRLFKIIDPQDLVWDWAFLYAIDEMIAEESGEPFNSRRLDLEMIRNPQAARETQREIAIWGIAEKYGADPVKLKNLNLSIEETEEIAKSGKYKKETQNEG